MNPSSSTPMTIREALQSGRISLPNREFLKPLCDWDDIAECSLLDSYIKVDRNSGGPALQIHAGYTNGFRSEEEILGLFGDVERWQSGRFVGAWGLTHPENSMRDSDGTKRKRDDREQETCPSCFILMSLSGVCGNCD